MKANDNPINIVAAKKMAFTIVYIFLNCTLSLLHAQPRSLDFQFGINVAKPMTFTQTALKTKWSHNFWMGLNYRIARNSTSAIHTGLFINGINYRFTNKDSPVTTFLTMTHLSIPLQLEKTLGKSPFAFKGGLEAKVMISGHQYTAEPTISNKIVFSSANAVYARFNLAARMGISYRTKGLEYFLQGSADLAPFYAYKTTRVFDNRIVFGFILFPIYKY